MRLLRLFSAPRRSRLPFGGPLLLILSLLMGFGGMAGASLGDPVAGAEIADDSSRLSRVPQLVDFQAATLNTGVELTWRTLRGTTTSHFLLQRSEDGMTFQTIAEIDGTPSAETVRYRHLDAWTHTGITYYRLIQVDLDGIEHGRAIAHIERREVIRAASAYTVSRSPFRGQVLVKNQRDIPLHVSLYDLTGQVREKVTLAPGASQKFAADLPSGIYLVEIDNGSERWVEQVVKE